MVPASPPSTSMASREVQTLFSYGEPRIGRRTNCRLLVDIMIFTLGLGTIVSGFVALFLLSGLSMLSVPLIAVSSVLVGLGLLCLGVGVFFVVSTLNKSIVGILQKQLSETEAEVVSLYKELAFLKGALPQEGGPIEGVEKKGGAQILVTTP